MSRLLRFHKSFCRPELERVQTVRGVVHLRASALLIHVCRPSISTTRPPCYLRPCIILQADCDLRLHLPRLSSLAMLPAQEAF